MFCHTQLHLEPGSPGAQVTVVPFKNSIRTKTPSHRLILDSPLGLRNLLSGQHTPIKATSEDHPETSVKMKCKVHLLRESVTRIHTCFTIDICYLPIPTVIKRHTALPMDPGYSIKSKDGNVIEFGQQCDQAEACLDFISSNILERRRTVFHFTRVLFSAESMAF